MQDIIQRLFLSEEERRVYILNNAKNKALNESQWVKGLDKYLKQQYQDIKNNLKIY